MAGSKKGPHDITDAVGRVGTSNGGSETAQGRIHNLKVESTQCSQFQLAVELHLPGIEGLLQK